MVHLNSEPKIGILMLNTKFKRPVGDIGNPQTFPFPVAYKIVEEATTDRVVNMADESLVKHFVHAAKELEAKGVRAITTSCGFLVLFQKKIQSELNVPFFSSSLMQIPIVQAVTGGKTGILTARKRSLTTEHFNDVNADRSQIIIEGMDAMSAFTNAIITQTEPLDEKAVADELRQSSGVLVQQYPGIKAVILECTNMSPYKEVIKQAAGVPVFDINSLVTYVHASL